MKKAYLNSGNIISPLGWTEAENFSNLLNGKIGLTVQDAPDLSNTPLPLAKVDSIELKHRFDSIGPSQQYTRFEQVAILSIAEALSKGTIEINEHTGFILSSTKGNIELLGNKTTSLYSENRLKLWRSAQIIADFFNITCPPIVVSNACVSGVIAMTTAQRLIRSGVYKDVIVVGADVLSKFIVSGFQSFKSLSLEPCKPFDAERDGLSLGEGAATAIFSHKRDTSKPNQIELIGGGSSNDANHISGPSRDGSGLLGAIRGALKGRTDIDYISSHGTATPYNDDMESKAVSNAGLSNVPASGLKGYFGHTLGAAGMIEALIGIQALKHNKILKTAGHSTFGVAEKINIVTQTEDRKIKTLLKLASGFGGCNAAALFEKHD